MSMVNRIIGVIFILGLIVFNSCKSPDKANGERFGGVSLTLIPPSTVSDKINLDIRAGLKNNTAKERKFYLEFYLDKVGDGSLLHKASVTLLPDTVAEVKFRWNTSGYAGEREIILKVESGAGDTILNKNIQILPSEMPSTKRIDGAFTGFLHWSEAEGKHWNDELRKATASQWAEMIDAQDKLGMNILVVQTVYHNPAMYAHKHTMERDGYTGVPFYPSALYPGRADIAARDPLEDVMAQADKRGVNVFVGIGMYAWFDFSKESLKWHEEVAKEIWEKYGHHPSFYGWYISEEQDGGLGTDEDKKNIVEFFKGFKKYIRQYTPEKPVMLATNSFHLKGAESTYSELLKHLDILCTFGFSRMPDTELPGEESAALLQKWCDEAGAHFWLDLEAFNFEGDNALVPKSFPEIQSEINSARHFEKIICYQFPGLFSSPEMSIKPGGKPTVDLYIEYKKYYDSLQSRVWQNAEK